MIDQYAEQIAGPGMGAGIMGFRDTGSQVGLGQRTAGVRPGIMNMLEVQASALDELYLNLTVLAEKLQPVLSPVPTNPDGEAKPMESNAATVEGRLQMISQLTRKINRVVEQLNREVNL